MRSKIIEFLNKLIDLGAAGFLINAAKYMYPEELQLIYQDLKNLSAEFGFEPNSRPFIYQEVVDIGVDSISRDEYTPIGTVTEFKGGIILTNAFRGQAKLSDLLDLWGPNGGLISLSSDALIFVDHQDTQRGTELPDYNILTYKDTKLFKMATAFLLAHPYGISKIMSSYSFDTVDQGPPHDEQGNILSPGINADDTCSNGWVCEHRWRQIYNMVGFKNAVSGTDVEVAWTGGDQQLAFCRGNKGFIVFNLDGIINEPLQTCLPSGDYCDIISGNLIDGTCTGKVITVNDDGLAMITMNPDDEDGVLALHINAVAAL